jgi:hypothetical protein
LIRACVHLRYTIWPTESQGQPMIPEYLVYSAIAVALAALAFLLIANVVIIVARLSKNYELANRVIKALMPFASLFRIPGNNPVDRPQ